MDYQAVFQRYELKYLLTPAQKSRVLAAIAPYMTIDQYGRDVIRNVYFDTENYRLVRRSIERPVYKEKLRLRSYRLAGPDSLVYVELKKKYRSVVYKRRISMPEAEAMAWLTGRGNAPQDSQIAREIDYFLRYYGPLRPAVFLSYEREAFCPRDQSDLRITFDENILCRLDHRSLEDEVGGAPLLPSGTTLMEIKCAGAYPMWLTDTLSGLRIYKTSFSKYGAAYQNLIYSAMQGEIDHDQRDLA